MALHGMPIHSPCLQHPSCLHLDLIDDLRVEELIPPKMTPDAAAKCAVVVFMFLICGALPAPTSSGTILLDVNTTLPVIAGL